jgi:hypothetical protein
MLAILGLRRTILGLRRARGLALLRTSRLALLQSPSLPRLWALRLRRSLIGIERNERSRLIRWEFRARFAGGF